MHLRKLVQFILVVITAFFQKLHLIESKRDRVKIFGNCRQENLPCRVELSSFFLHEDFRVSKFRLLKHRSRKFAKNFYSKMHFVHSPLPRPHEYTSLTKFSRRKFWKLFTWSSAQHLGLVRMPPSEFCSNLGFVPKMIFAEISKFGSRTHLGSLLESASWWITQFKKIFMSKYPSEVRIGLVFLCEM